MQIKNDRVEKNIENGKINIEKKTYGTNDNDVDVTSRISNTGDVLDNTIGEFGRWQCQISIMMSLLLLPLAWIQLGMLFLAPPTEFTCKQPILPDAIIEKWPEIMSGGDMKPGSCLIKDPTSKKGDSMIPCPWGFEYSDSITNSSIITEWDLVCERESLLNLAQLAMMFGVMSGGLLFGAAADKLGRKPILSISIFLQTMFGLISAVIPWYYGFVTSQFFLAFANGGTMVTSFVICMEIVGCQWRTITPILYHISAGIGSAILAAIAYYLRDWRQLQLGLGILGAIFIIYIWTASESPRWLLAVGRRREATVILDKATESNGTNKNSIIKILEEWSRLNEEKNTQVGLMAFVTNSELLKRIFLLGVNCLISDLCFYGFSQHIGQFFDSIYMSVALQGLLYSLSGIVAVVVVNRNGRRQSIAMSSCFTGLCFFALLLVSPNDWVNVLFTMTGLIGMAVSHPVLYLLGGELFPTTIRASAVGICMAFSKVGALLASTVLYTGEAGWYMPLIIFGCLSFIQVLLTILLPETNNFDLPESMDEIRVERKSVA